MNLDRPEGMRRDSSRRARLCSTSLSPLILLLFLPLFATAIARRPAREDRLEAARESVAPHRYGEAIPILQTELADHPENDDARLLLARVLSWQAAL